MTARAEQEPVIIMVGDRAYGVVDGCLAPIDGETPEQTAEWEAAQRRADLMLAKPVPYPPDDRL